MSEKIETLLEEQNQSIRDLIDAVNKSNSLLEKFIILNIRSQTWFTQLRGDIQIDIDKKMKSMD